MRKLQRSVRPDVTMTSLWEGGKGGICHPQKLGIHFLIPIPKVWAQLFPFPKIQKVIPAHQWPDVTMVRGARGRLGTKEAIKRDARRI